MFLGSGYCLSAILFYAFSSDPWSLASVCLLFCSMLLVLICAFSCWSSYWILIWFGTYFTHYSRFMSSSNLLNLVQMFLHMLKQTIMLANFSSMLYSPPFCQLVKLYQSGKAYSFTYWLHLAFLYSSSNIHLILKR